MSRDGTLFSERITRIRSRFPEVHVDGILFLDMKNIRYLTGFTGSDGVLLIENEREILLVDGRYTNQARIEVRHASVIEYRDKLKGIESILMESAADTVGFEAMSMSVNAYLILKERVRSLILKPMSTEMSGIRAVKDEAEIARMKKASEISFQAMETVRGLIRPGSMEKDIALELEYQMGRNGAEQAAFPTIVASGENSSLPHAQPGLRKIERGDIVTIDYGAVYEGYHSDETWTVLVGHAGDKQQDVYSIVKEAHDRALEAVKAGIPCREIDQVARSFIEDKKLGAYFSHGTGHGVGLDVHEAPRISNQSEQVLERGMVVTIEPGVYLPGLWGVRIEDMVLVRDDGCEILTKMPKKFTVLN